jgi:hypothetical protein
MFTPLMPNSFAVQSKICAMRVIPVGAGRAYRVLSALARRNAVDVAWFAILRIAVAIHVTARRAAATSRWVDPWHANCSYVSTMSELDEARTLGPRCK